MSPDPTRTSAEREDTSAPDLYETTLRRLNELEVANPYEETPEFWEMEMLRKQIEHWTPRV